MLHDDGNDNDHEAERITITIRDNVPRATWASPMLNGTRAYPQPVGQNAVQIRRTSMARGGFARPRIAGKPGILVIGCALRAVDSTQRTAENRERAAEEIMNERTGDPIHEPRLLPYLRLSGHPVGLLINSNVSRLRDGIVRRVLTRP